MATAMKAYVGSPGPSAKRPAAKVPKFIPRLAGYSVSQSLDYKAGATDIDAEIERAVWR